MEKKAHITIILDKRRAKANGTYPVKLRVFTSQPRKQKLYPTKFEFTESEFNATWLTTKTRTEYKTNKILLQEIDTRANLIADKLNPFTFSEFERQLEIKKTGKSGLVSLYNSIAEKFKGLDQWKTAIGYEISLKSLNAYKAFATKKTDAQINYADITPAFLVMYEKYMVEHCNRSITTVSIYLRVLRAVFNAAIEAGEINANLYPFGKKKYQIPISKGVKKALSFEALTTLRNFSPRTFEQQRAKDFWFLSFNCNGMNFKDIANLKNEDIKNNQITFIRAKTKNTNRGNIKTVTVELNNYALELIEKHRGKDKSPQAYVFNIIEQGQTEREKIRRITNFIKAINQGMKRLSKEIGLPTDISTYWARHSFATTLIRKNVSMEFVSEALSHNSLNTTKNYFAGFEDSVKREVMSNLMDF